LSGKEDNAASEPAPSGNAYLAAILAWVLPGAGHAYLGRWRRAVAFLVLVMASLAIGCHLEGHLPWTFSGSPLAVLATYGCLGSGAPSIFLHLALSYEGTIEAPGYEVGSAFILTAGLMNLLLVLDAWDIAVGRKP
jgi:hypothetical protein